jgi:2-phosphosulfolactate phosphatase
MNAHYGVRCAWGLQGVLCLAPACDIVIVVDVLSFSSAVEIAVSRGARVFPSAQTNGPAERIAHTVGAMAPARRGDGPSLSPASLMMLPSGAAIVLASPNGASCSLQAAAHDAEVVAGCLRNAASVAHAARARERIGVVAAGERWPDGTPRRCEEDLIGAGAILSRLGRDDLSPEATMAADAFTTVESHLPDALEGCMSALELTTAGFGDDVRLAFQLDVATAVPVLARGPFPYFRERAT